MLTMLLLYVAYLLAPGAVQGPLLLCAGLMVVVVAFTSVELTLYLLILSTLLSPELMFGGGEMGVGTSATESRGITLRVDDLMLTIICLTWLFRMALYKELGTVRKTPINQPIAWYWMAALFATLAGFYAGRIGIFGFFFVLKYLEYFVLFYMVANQIHNHDTVKRYFMVLLFTCFVVSVLGMAQIPTGQRVSAPFEGEIGEPNTFGGYLLLMFSLVLGMFLHSAENKQRLWLAILMAVILVPFAFTESRSSYLAFMTAIGLFILLTEQKRLLITVCLIGLALAPFVIPQNVMQRMAFTFTQAEEAGQIHVGGMRIDTSTSERLRAWEKVLTKDLPNRPLLGAGVTGGTFMDSQYPRVLSETGLIGLALFLWLLRRMWVLLRQCYDELHDPMLKGASLGALCGFGGLLVHAIGANSFIIVRIMEPFMIVLGLLMAALLINQTGQQAAQQAGLPDESSLAKGDGSVSI
ncbi:MAG: O-antigen ligase family protein [Mariprofundaceae bacterium]